MKNKGFTLIELLIALSVLGGLLLVGGVGFHCLRQRQTADYVMIRLYRTLQLARYSAIKHRDMVTICPAHDHSHCGIDWNKGFLLFLDRYGDGKIHDPKDVLRAVQNSINVQGDLSWRGFRKGAYIQFTPEGFTNNQNGTFTYCPKDLNTQHARALFVSKTGKLRFSQDSNQDGIHENSQGKRLNCVN